MKVLVINCGSSSLKYQLIDSQSEEVLAKGLCERIGIEGSSVSLVPIVLEERAAIPSQAEHLEVLLHRIDVFGLRALTVQILDAQNDFTTLGVRDEPCRKCGIDVPRMHAPRGRRSKTPDHLLAHRITPFAPS